MTNSNQNHQHHHHHHIDIKEEPPSSASSSTTIAIDNNHHSPTILSSSSTTTTTTGEDRRELSLENQLPIFATLPPLKQVHLSKKHSSKKSSASKRKTHGSSSSNHTPTSTTTTITTISKSHSSHEDLGQGTRVISTDPEMADSHEKRSKIIVQSEELTLRDEDDYEDNVQDDDDDDDEDDEDDDIENQVNKDTTTTTNYGTISSFHSNPLTLPSMATTSSSHHHTSSRSSKHHHHHHHGSSSSSSKHRRYKSTSSSDGGTSMSNNNNKDVIGDAVDGSGMDNYHDGDEARVQKRSHKSHNRSHRRVHSSHHGYSSVPTPTTTTTAHFTFSRHDNQSNHHGGSHGSQGDGENGGCSGSSVATLSRQKSRDGIASSSTSVVASHGHGHHHSGGASSSNSGSSSHHGGGKRKKCRRTKSEIQREEEHAVINLDDKVKVQNFITEGAASYNLTMSPPKIKIPTSYSSIRKVFVGGEDEPFLSDEENEEAVDEADNKCAEEKKVVDEKQQLVYLNDEPANRKVRRRMPSNYIRTTKYTFLTFLPFNLFEQFKKISNIYFLVTMVITLIPGISPVFPASSIMPLAFILTLTAIKDGIEDLARFREDLKANGAKVRIVRSGELKEVKTSNVKIGDIVFVKKDQAFPADLICLSSHREDGACYVQTANLDGESNLKPKFSVRDTVAIRDDHKVLSSIRAKVNVELPNARLDKFNGSFRLKELCGEKVKRKRVPLDVDNVLMRGSILKNTRYIYGAVIYVGQDTRLFKNLKKPKARMSLLDKRLNMLLCFLVLLQQAICGLYVGLASFFQNRTTRFSFYMNKILPGRTSFEYVVRNWMTYFILLNLVIPMSLFVGLEFVKAFQAKLMEADDEMKIVDDRGETISMIAKTSNLNQELSQIDVIFSDKTGTLTENLMEYKQCWVDGTYFGEDKGMLSWMMKHPKVKPVNDRTDPIGYHMYMIHEFLLGIVLNHTIIPERSDEGEILFEGPSPDEIALISCAKQNGYLLVQRTTSGLEIVINGTSYFYEILVSLAFTSDRKRMSVITRSPEGRIVLYSKGADNIMFARSIISSTDKSDIERALDVFSQSGLRTLVICRKELSVREYEVWSRQYQKATISTKQNKDDLIEELSSAIEQGFEVLGATAIEDKLQQGVPEAIEFLRRAGFQIWVLTGDKPETARNIAYTANVIQKHSIEIRIQESQSRKHCKKKLMIAWTFLEENKKKNVDYALLIDAQSLNFILGQKKIEDKLLQIITYCKTAVCCRLTALQKSQIVQLVERRCNKKGLGIGDGVNDVSMIQAATVGVGIIGREGSQAARASDYAIPRFKHLVRLLAVHGRYSYIRNSDYLHLSFYKNMIVVYSQLLYAIFAGFTAQTLFESWILSLYNTIFTFLPPMISGIFEKDLPEDILLANPELYKENKNDALFNKKTLIIWFVTPLVHSAIIFFGTYAMSNSFVLGKTQDDLWSFGTICMTTAITVIMIRHSMELKNWTIITHAVVWASWASYIIFIVLYTLIPQLGILGKTTYYWTALEYFKSPKALLITLLLVVACITPDFTFKFIKRYLFPSDWEVVLLRNRLRLGCGCGKNDACDDLASKKTKRSSTLAVEANT